ncbi:MAG: outer rane receptor protein [Chitinophagaceae bacterium]|nr:outer rane receptor protein [Chitinophagaceae bacterium]
MKSIIQVRTFWPLLVWLLLFNLISSKLQAQETLSLSGIVKDKSTGEALPFATIQIKGTTTGATTNVDGYFLLNDLPSDTSTIIVQYPGYAFTEIKLTSGHFKSGFKIEMAQEVKSLDEVTVVGVREQVTLVDRANISTIKLTPKVLRQLPNVGEKDIMRAFQLMPGVGASNESSSGLYVRGGTPDQNLILYDGFTVYHVDHLYGFYSAFNSNALKDVQLYKGGFESRFGGRLSSVTEITGKDGNQNKFNVGADLSLLSMNAFVEVPIGKKFSSLVAFRKSYRGPIYNQVFGMFNSTGTGQSSGSKGGSNATVASYFYDVNGKFTYRPTNKDIISLSIYNGTDNLNNSSVARTEGVSSSTFSSSSTDLTNYGNLGSSLKWSRRWSDKLYGNTLFSYSNYYSDRNNSQQKSITDSLGATNSSSQGLFENNDLKDYSFKSDYEYDLKKNVQLQFGGFGTYYDINYTYAQNDTVTILNRSDQATLSGIYVQSKIDLLKNRLHVLPGMRLSYFSTTGKPYIEPRLSASYDLTERWTLKGAIGRYNQFANRVTREDILSGSRDFWLLSGTGSVPVSSANHYILGASYETPKYLFSVEGYYKTLSNLTEYSLRFNPVAGGGGVTYNENFYNGKGFSRGVEFLAQRKVGKFQGWVSYTLSQTMNNFSIYSSNYYPASQDVTNEFKTVFLYKLKKWSFSATWIYGTGKPYTAPSGGYNVTLLDGSTQSYYTVTAKNGQRLPAYHRADLAVNYILFGGKKERREIGYIGLSVFNVYNRTNVWYKQYAITDGQITQTNVNYLGITPNITLSFKLR